MSLLKRRSINPPDISDKLYIVSVLPKRVQSFPTFFAFRVNKHPITQTHHKIYDSFCIFFFIKSLDCYSSKCVNQEFHLLHF